MKKLLFATFLVAFILPVSYAINPETVKKDPLASEIMLTLFGSDKKVSLEEFLKMTPKHYKEITGKKMKFKDKISMKLAQRQLKKCMNSDGTVNMEKLNKVDTSGFNIGGFALGLFLSIIGVLIAYLISKGEQPNLVKWAWIGAAVGLIIYLLLIII